MKELIALLLLPLFGLVWLALALAFAGAVLLLSTYYRLKSFFTGRATSSPTEHEDLLRSGR